MAMPLRKKLLILPPLLLGLAVLVFMVRTKEPPATRDVGERATAVRVVDAPVVDLVPRATGYGYVRPELTWEAVAEVAGQVVEMHPELQRGALVAEGELLLRIDPAKRLTASEQSRAGVRALLARLEDLEQRRANLRKSLEVERRALELARQELARYQTLAERDTIAASELDAKEQAWLAQKNKVQDLENQIALLPAQRQDLLAQLEQARARLTETRIDLEKTEIRAPFDGRLAAVSVERGQAVGVGQTMAVLDSIGVAETLAQFPLHAFRTVIPRGAQPFSQGADMQRLRAFLDVGAVVRLNIGDDTLEWSGRLVRVREEVDAETRTIGVYVAVDNPYLKAEPGRRPPLLRNMYCEVELRGKPRPGTVVVPRAAVRQGEVLVAGEGDRLERRPVTVDFTMLDMAVIATGLSGGERVVVSPLPYAVQGMLLKPARDEELAERLAAEAECRGPGACAPVESDDPAGAGEGA
jgi:RND family efflux transporter MFP subunit